MVYEYLRKQKNLMLKINQKETTLTSIEEDKIWSEKTKNRLKGKYQLAPRDLRGKEVIEEEIDDCECYKILRVSVENTEIG